MRWMMIVMSVESANSVDAILDVAKKASLARRLKCVWTIGVPSHSFAIRVRIV